MIWRSEPRPRPRASAAAGYTLIELMVVLAILGLLATMITARRLSVSPSMEARAAAEEVSGALRAARGKAMASNRSAAVTFDVATPLYRLDNEPPMALPSDLQLQLLTSVDQLKSQASGEIRFDPDGGSSGGRVTIAGGDRIWQVGVDWLTGRVSIAAKGF